MLILAFETSAKAASAALLCDGLLLGEYYQNDGQTHSRTVMKLAADLLQNCGRQPAEVDAVAYANGPGSFTGIRIGVAAAKGFCWGRDIPCVPVSTLEAMAQSLSFAPGIVCACMDARRQQLYNAVFRCDGESLTRLCPDRAIALDELAAGLKSYHEPIYLIGDGSRLFFDSFGTALPSVRLIPEQLRQQRASGVAVLGYREAISGQLISAAASVPNYLRLSQAERERREKELKGE